MQEFLSVCRIFGQKHLLKLGQEKDLGKVERRVFPIEKLDEAFFFAEDGDSGEDGLVLPFVTLPGTLMPFPESDPEDLDYLLTPSVLKLCFFQRKTAVLVPKALLA